MPQPVTPDRISRNPSVDNCSLDDLARWGAGIPDDSIVPVTLGLLIRGASRNGGWSRQQLAMLGVPWPTVKGWRKRLLQTTVTKAEADRFVALRNLHLKGGHPELPF